jgi:hypothetical protein
MVAFVLGRVFPGFDVLLKASEGFQGGGPKIGIVSYKFREEALKQAQEVMEDQHLTVTVRAGTNADGGYRE